MTNRRSDEGRHEEIGGLMSRGRMEDGKMGDETIGLMVVMMELFPVCLRTKLGRFVS